MEIRHVSKFWKFIIHSGIKKALRTSFMCVTLLPPAGIDVTRNSFP